LLLAIATVVLCAAVVQAVPVNISGHWQVEIASGYSIFGGTMAFSEVGQTVIGRTGHTAIEGKMVSDTKMDASWNGPKGAGWMTLNFDASGDSFKGEWGFHGRKADGSFSGRRLPAGATH
ncbi:MAG: hypothetical protein M3Z41_10575, partial [Candidatus Eremiobacteraeota bacterium]|nr:hypothetical protein [Candidatus Eremiobacteraeota bacterium]